MTGNATQLQAEGLELKSAGRLADAIERFAAAVNLAPTNGTARHNLASALGDAGRWAEAETHLRKGFSGGLDAPESWLVLARALQAQGRLSEGEAAYREAIRRRYTLYEAHRELAQLAWMGSGDPARATADIEGAIAQSPRDATLRIIKSQAEAYSGRMDASMETLAAACALDPSGSLAPVIAAHTALKLGRIEEGLAYGERAVGLAPHDPAALLALAAGKLASGRPDAALGPVVQVIRQNPSNQTAIAFLATAMRLTGDPQYGHLHDYGALVRDFRVAAPDGWRDLPAYLSDLADALQEVHHYREHPFSQSLRHGSQAQNLLQHPHPAIRALPGVLDGPIRRYIAGLGTGPDPIRSRNTGGYRIQGLWSVQLFPHGYHADHTHQEGWISSAFYVEPVDRPAREGWIKFGEPGTPTTPALPPDHFVKPEPGMLVLFPSYMWHGTVPFGGDRPRLTCAFDLVPAPG